MQICLTLGECCANLHSVQDDLLPTASVAELLGKSVATINRWATEGRLKPALEMGGKTGARLFRRSDVEALIPEEPAEVAG